MALTKNSVDKVRKLYNELFDEKKPELIDRKADGGYEAVRTYQERVDGRDLEKFCLLSRDIGNSFVVRPHDPDKVCISFF